MEFFDALGLVLLTMVGYSAGAVLLKRGRQITPGPLDFVLVIILWVVVFTLHSTLGKGGSLLIGLAGGCICGALVTGLIRRNETEKSNTPTMRIDQYISPLQRIREWWLAFAADLGEFQGRILMGFFYFLVVTPFGLLVSLLGDPLKLHENSRQTFWAESSTPVTSIREAKRQF